jgi:glutamate-5-semialdehyde dehydrogenase
MTDASDATTLARTLARNARAAASRLAVADRATKDRALTALARLLRDETPAILEANARDLAEGRAAGLGAAMLDRLMLDERRVEAMARGVEAVVALPDPVGTVEPMGVRPNGLRVSRMRIPLGVICIIYEARPNVTVDAGALCIKSGNAPILKGGKEAFHSNGALVALMRRALGEAGLPADGIQAVATSDRDVLLGLIRASGDVDLVIPRGGEGLIRYVTEHATVPVIQHYKGVCHVYVHADADLSLAADIALNAKVSRPGVCNAMETLLIHRDAAPGLVTTLFPRLRAAGVELRGDARVRALAPDVAPASEDDWHAEYLDLILAVRLVDTYEDAVAHIARYGSSHTEAIVTRDAALGERFLREVPSSCVLVNASTRFNDGFELGLGAEIGISTSRLHAFGPMGLEELTTRKFIVHGEGQVRG